MTALDFSLGKSREPPKTDIVSDISLLLVGSSRGGEEERGKSTKLSAKSNDGGETDIRVMKKGK